MLSLRLILFICFFSILAPINAVQGGEQPSSNFNAGLVALQNKQLAQARSDFTKLVADQPACSSCLFNLALTEYRDHHLGLALGYWRRGLRLDPSNKAIRAAIQEASKQVSSRDLSREDSLWENMHAWVLEPYSQLFFAWLTSLLLMAALYAWIEWFAKNKRLKEEEFSAKPWIALLMSAVFCAGLALNIAKAIDMATDRATVISAKASVLSAPDALSASLFEIQEGSEINVLASKGDWIQIQASGGGAGWVAKSVLIVDQPGNRI